jgi:hypothetical protein
VRQRRCKLCGRGMGSEDGGAHASCLAVLRERKSSAARVDFARLLDAVRVVDEARARREVLLAGSRSQDDEQELAAIERAIGRPAARGRAGQWADEWAAVVRWAAAMQASTVPSPSAH